jgi:hypothetical protein
MELTPIKIKGKGGPKKTTWKPPKPESVVPKRKRDETEEEGDEGAVEPPPRRRFKAKKPAAAIEELPTEILERIIFMSGNLNFLRSSLRVGYRFSSPSFRTELLEAAFAPTWDVWYGRGRPKVDLSILDLEPVPGDPDFQVRFVPWSYTHVQRQNARVKTD